MDEAFGISHVAGSSKTKTTSSTSSLYLIYLFSSTLIPFIHSFTPISFQPSLVDLSRFHSQEKFQHHFNIRSAIMAVKPSFSVPTIDISPYLRSPSSPEGLKVISSVREACTGTGFFQLVGHGIEPELQQRVFNGAEKLFKLPMEEKVKLDMSHSVGASNRGYELIGGQGLQEGTLPDLKEVRIFCFVFLCFLGGCFFQREGMISEGGWRRVEFSFSLYSVLEARELEINLEWEWDLQDEG
jgi:hypothetical protein